ncbi:MAG: chemotaxis protein CheA [Cyclobacteriaceae bacterium]|nr:chemotaxis protein CheA [Cyclobacteriaceae bacterium]
MERLQQVFKEESDDLLQNLEQSLLSLEKNPDDENRIAEIFRAMHTLKGNSSMFGFSKIADFVHNLETLYSHIRDKNLKATSSIIDCTFQVLDLLKVLVEDPIVTDENNLRSLADLSVRILTFLENVDGSETSQETVKSTNVVEDSSPSAVDAKATTKTFYISFIPSEEIFEDGTNPLFLIEELTEMGKSKVFTYIKPFEIITDYNVEKCYTSWEILLATESSLNEIKDVFLFVEDTAEINIEELSGGNLIANADFINAINYTGYSGEKQTAEKLKEIIDSMDIKEITSQVKEKQAAMAQQIPDKDGAPPTAPAATKEKTISSVRVGSDKLDDLMNLVSELVTTQAGLSLYAEHNHTTALESITENVEKLSRQLRDIAFSMTLIPINNLFGRFQRMIRDVSANLNKSVEFITQGGETELDKTIIEYLTDPLLHLLRNSLDHGIESPEERKRLGKPPKGTITLKAYYSGVNVFIQIEDDGKGIDANVIKASAIKKGMITPETELTEREIYDLIFSAGFSTAKEVTDVSGRGVGMDVVKRNIADIRGEITVDSKVNIGTKITLKLPLTLSITDGLLVQISDTYYLIPLSVVSKCHEVTKKSLADELNKIVVLDGDQIPFLDLRKEFRVKDEAPEFFQLIVVENEGRRVGLTVDSIVGEYQAVLKPLGKYYRHQDFISGGTILGDGTIALVMDTSKIINKFSQVNKEELV